LGQHCRWRLNANPLGRGIVPEIDIRQEDSSDHARVFEVEQSAFEGTVQPRLVESLRASAEPQLSLVALVEGELVGHIFFSPVTFESKEAPSAAQLSPIAVDPACQGQGIGSALIRAALERCPSLGWEAVFLVGNPIFYARFGFAMAKPLGLSCDGPHDPFLQVLELRPGALEGVRGQVSFHPAFEDAEAEAE
jgi:putative acetyltransferase